jgi:hypothetical protein
MPLEEDRSDSSHEEESEPDQTSYAYTHSSGDESSQVVPVCPLAVVVSRLFALITPRLISPPGWK